MKKLAKSVAGKVRGVARRIIGRKPKDFVIQVEHVPNPDIIIIHTKKVFPKSESDPCFASNIHDMPGNKHPLIRSVRRFSGVLEVSSGDYHLRITKAKMFSWDEILPKVRRALVKHFTDGLELQELAPIIPHPD